MSTTGVAPGTLRILIVDDETIVRDSLGAWFRQDGHRVDARGERQGGAPARQRQPLRHRVPRHQDAGHGRPRAAGAARRGRPGAERRPHDRVRVGRDGGQGDEERGLRLHRQAVRPRRPLDARQARGRAPLAARREPAAQEEPGERGAAAAPRRLAGDAARGRARRDASPRPTRRCSSPASRAPARRSWRARSTPRRPAATTRWSWSTAARCPRASSRASCSATRRAPSPARGRGTRASSSRPRAAPSSSTRSAR